MVFLRTSVLLYGLFLLFGPIVRLADSTLPAELIPSVWVFALWIVPLLLLAHIRSVFNRIVCLAWIGWALVGSVNVLGSFLFYGDFYLLDATPAALIYIAFTTACFAGILAYERTNPSRALNVSPTPTDRVDPLTTRTLLAFPFIWFASVYRTLGYIPVLLQSDITEDIYEIDYGPLYGYSLLLVISMFIALERSFNAKTRSAVWGYRALVAFFGACSMIDSKRVALMIFMVSLLAYLVRTRGSRFLRAGAIAVIAFATISLYVGGQLIRNGVDSEFFSNGALRLATVGVEYRDFVYTENNFEPGRIPNYDWAVSAVGSMVNSAVLEAAGIDKQKLVEMGSAYAWKNMLGSDFGIRTGIVSELYFAYGNLGILFVFAFGLLTAWISAKVAHARKQVSLMFICVVYALLVLSIVGQTMATTGGLTLLLYGWIAYSLLRWISGLGSSPKQEIG